MGGDAWAERARRELEAALRDAHRDGTQLLEWLNKAAGAYRKKRIFYTQKRATRLRSEEWSRRSHLRSSSAVSRFSCWTTASR